MNAEEIGKAAKKKALAMESDLDVKNTKAGIIILPTFNNATIYLEIDLELKGLFQFNEFAYRSEITRRPPWGKYGDYPRDISDHDVIHLRKMFAKKYGIDFQKSNVDDAVTCVATKNHYDPVKNYLSGLKWGGTPRLDKWLTTYLGVKDNTYSNFVGKMTLAGACSRIDKPGIKYDYMLILEGKQGIGKSKALQALGGEWFREMSLTDRTKETVEKMQGAWIIEVPELSVFKKRDIESLKAFITVNKDAERLPWGRRSVIFPRRNIFFGTINPNNSGYLTDTTGNRRFLPVACHKIDVGALLRDKDQLWAEAWKAYKEKTPLYLSDDITNLSLEEQETREIIGEWREPILTYLEGRDRVTSVEVWQECLGGNLQNLDRFSQMRIADCLYKFGWIRKSIRINNETVKGFMRPVEEVTDEQIELENFEEKDDNPEEKSRPWD